MNAEEIDLTRITVVADRDQVRLEGVGLWGGAWFLVLDRTELREDAKGLRVVPPSTDYEACDWFEAHIDGSTLVLGVGRASVPRECWTRLHLTAEDLDRLAAWPEGTEGYLWLPTVSWWSWERGGCDGAGAGSC